MMISIRKNITIETAKNQLGNTWSQLWCHTSP